MTYKIDEKWVPVAPLLMTTEAVAQRHKYATNADYRTRVLQATNRHRRAMRKIKVWRDAENARRRNRYAQDFTYRVEKSRLSRERYWSDPVYREWMKAYQYAYARKLPRPNLAEFRKEWKRIERNRRRRERYAMKKEMQHDSVK